MLRIGLLCNLFQAQSTPEIYSLDRWIPVGQVVNDQNPFPPISESWKDPHTSIFVGLVDYRDPRCSTTIEYLFSRAKYPDRLHIGKRTF